MYHLVVLFFIVLFIMNCKKNNLTEEPYINYQEISYQGSEEKNCPQIHADNYQELTNNRQMIQPFGYTKNDLFHMTRFMKTDIPLPTDPDFFKHI